MKYVVTKNSNTGSTELTQLKKHYIAVGGGSRLPSEYQEVEYLEGTGEQYIKDIFDFGENTIEFDIMPIDMSSGFNNWLFGLYDVSGTGLDYATYGITISREDLYQIYTGTVTPKRAAEGVREKYTFVTSAGAYSTKKLGLFFETGYPNRAFKGRVYSFRVKRTSDNEPIRDLVPCYRKSDNVAGMYDLVNDVFYTNSGTGEFQIGQEVRTQKFVELKSMYVAVGKPAESKLKLVRIV